jgi:hypothetical protein
MTTTVTPRRDDPGPTVGDERRHARGSAASGGDICGPHDVAVGHEATAAAGKDAARGFGYPSLAERTCRRRAPLVDEHHGNAGQCGLVGQDPGQMHPPPLSEAAVLARPGISAGDALGVTDDEGAHPLAHRPGHHCLGRLVMGLAHPATVTGLGAALGSS